MIIHIPPDETILNKGSSWDNNHIKPYQKIHNTLDYKTILSRTWHFPFPSLL
jgi:hypothetical protein